MGITRFIHNTGTTISTTEISLINATSTIATDTTDGAYSVILDMGASVAGDFWQIAMYEKAHDSDAAVKEIIANIGGIIPGGKWESPTFTRGNGWDFTIKKISGTDRSIGWSIWKWA